MFVAPLIPRHLKAADSVKATDEETPADIEGRFHPKVEKIASTLSPLAARLLDLVVKSTDHFQSGCLINVDRAVVAQALSVRRQDAEAAREELVESGLLKLHTNRAGIMGCRPTLTAASKPKLPQSHQRCRQ